MAGGVPLKGRNSPPSHYLLKIESASLLSRASIEAFVSDDFEAGGYKWKFMISPAKHQSNDVKYIGVGLVLMGTSSLPAGWEVNVVLNFFVFNGVKNQYFGIEDPIKARLHPMNPAFGISNFIDMDTFFDPVNGFYLGEKCFFGVEVFVIKNTCIEECLSMIEKPITYDHTWKVTNFSSIVDEKYVSESFGFYGWNISLYPNSVQGVKGNSISIELDVCRPKIPPSTKLFVKYLIRFKREGKDDDVEGEHLFGPSNNDNPGCSLLLAEVNDSAMGYLVNDALIIQAEVTLLGLVHA